MIDVFTVYPIVLLRTTRSLQLLFRGVIHGVRLTTDSDYAVPCSPRSRIPQLSFLRRTAFLSARCHHHHKVFQGNFQIFTSW